MNDHILGANNTKGGLDIGPKKAKFAVINGESGNPSGKSPSNHLKEIIHE